MRIENLIANLTRPTMGIGLACAEKFARECAKVVLTGRSQYLGNQAAKEIRGMVDI